MKKKLFLFTLLALIFTVIFFRTKIMGEPKKKKMPPFRLESPAFANGNFIPRRYTCQGKDVNPPLHWQNVPAGCQSLALIVDDPDAPGGTWTHWLLWKINPQLGEIGENSLPPGSIQGYNDFRRLNYGGPCPPQGTHRYFFRLYALDFVPQLPSGANRNSLETVIKPHIIGQAILMGRYRQQ